MDECLETTFLVIFHISCRLSVGCNHSIEVVISVLAKPGANILLPFKSIPQIIENTKDDFFSRIINTLIEDVNICWEKLNEIPCISCPYKPQGGMFVYAKVHVSMIYGIKNDFDFCKKLAKEESVIVLPVLFDINHTYLSPSNQPCSKKHSKGLKHFAKGIPRSSKVRNE
ncbi:hypothetical protein V2J09_002726 [Rumex salicifolius]